jgi:segregation and condensation protein A
VGQCSLDRATGDPSLVIDVDGFEGPLDLLLHLARTQKVDLAKISVLALAEQYLQFVEKARALRLELAADYLVMAAWLAYLKSRLLIPQSPKGDEPSGEEMAAQLAFRLKRLEAMREAATRLVNRNRLGRDVFARGAPEATITDKTSSFEATLYDLLTAYAAQKQRQMVTQVTIGRRRVWSLGDARVILVRLIGELKDWTALDQYLVRYLSDPEERVTAIASSFAASLEMVREGGSKSARTARFNQSIMRRPVEAGLSAGSKAMTMDPGHMSVAYDHEAEQAEDGRCARGRDLTGSEALDALKETGAGRSRADCRGAGVCLQRTGGGKADCRQAARRYAGGHGDGTAWPSAMLRAGSILSASVTPGRFAQRPISAF